MLVDTCQSGEKLDLDATGAQLALESSEWKKGAFTYVIFGK